MLYILLKASIIAIKLFSKATSILTSLLLYTYIFYKSSFRLRNTNNSRLIASKASKISVNSVLIE